jgi:hypothetical protein
MPPRRTQERQVAASITPEVARGAIKKQLALLKAMRATNYHESEAAEQEWTQFTQSIIERAFGNPSSNLQKFYTAKSAGDYFLAPFGGSYDHGLDQRNFLARNQALEAFLNAVLAEIELLVPESEILGTYAPGNEYEFYKDITSILLTAKSAITIIDPYLNREIFEVYVNGIDRSVKVRILTSNPPGDALAIASKYASGGNLELRTTSAIHDRAIFADGRVWMVGQSLKDAAKKKPTYIIEHDAALMLPMYKDIWNNAKVII